MERRLNKISWKLRTNLDKFSFYSLNAQLNDLKLNVSQTPRQLGEYVGKGPTI